MNFNQILHSDFEEIERYINYDDFLKSKWLITGGTGMIGSYIVAFLGWLNKKKNLQMSVTIISRSKKLNNHHILQSLINTDFLKVQYLDLSDNFQIPKLETYDYVMHAASNASPNLYLNNPISTISTNVKATQILLEQLKLNGKLKCFLYVSSGEIYGEPTTIPTPETYVGTTNLESNRACYVESKKFAEVLVRAYNKEYNMPVKIVRPIHVFGPGFKESDGRVWADFINSSVKFGKIEILSDGMAQRGFCYAASAVTQIFSVITEGKVGTSYNIGNDHPTTILALAEEIKKIVSNLLGKNVDIKVNGEKNYYTKESPNISCPDISKVLSLQSSNLHINLNEGLSRTINWFSSKKN